MNKAAIKKTLMIFTIDIAKILKYSELNELSLKNIEDWIDDWMKENIRIDDEVKK